MNLQPHTLGDSYKLTHHSLGAGKQTYGYSNFTPRSVKHMPLSKRFYDNKVVLFGLQAFVLDYLIDDWNRNFFQKPKNEVILPFKRRVDAHCGKDKISIDHFKDLHDLGYLPLRIKALPEGSVVDVNIPYFTIRNTKEKYGWLVNYLETVLSTDNWKPCVTATLTRSMRLMCQHYAKETCENDAHVPFQIHGFEMRGMSNRHDTPASAGLLLNSLGSDTFPCIEFFETYYGADCEKEIIACSVPATEHAVTSLGTVLYSELEYFRKCITEYHPNGIISLVSDTYDFFKVMTEYTVALKDDIMKRDGKVVFRPDSGDPIKIVCGYHYDPDPYKSELIVDDSHGVFR